MGAWRARGVFGYGDSVPPCACALARFNAVCERFQRGAVRCFALSRMLCAAVVSPAQIYACASNPADERYMCAVFRFMLYWCASNRTDRRYARACFQFQTARHASIFFRQTVKWSFIRSRDCQTFSDRRYARNARNARSVKRFPTDGILRSGPAFARSACQAISDER